MNEFNGNHIGFIIEWGQLLALSLAAAALFPSFLIVRRRRLYLSGGVLGRLGAKTPVARG